VAGVRTRRVHRHPGDIFEERWAFAALDAAMARLEGDYQRTGRQRLFDQLRPYLTGDTDVSYADCAKALAMTEGALRVAMHRMRKHFGRCLRETLADTVDDPADVDSELDYLLKVVSRCRQPAAGV